MSVQSVRSGAAPATRRAAHGPRLSRSSQAAFVVALVAFAMFFVANAWVGDDAFISFRVADNIVHGFGPRWNVAERVQAFTDPLWTFTMAGAEFFTHEVLYTSMVVSLVLCLAMLTIVWRWLHRDADRWLALAMLLSSKAFVDYTSSGLEYALSYLLLAAFVAELFPRLDGDTAGIPLDVTRLPWLTFIAALSFVNREDTILLYLPVLVYLVIKRGRALTVRELTRLVVACAPAWGWLLFSLIYYGFPFPNTYYAKVNFGAPHWLQIHQGLAYVASSLRFDPITLCTITAAVAMAFAIGAARVRAMAIGAAAYVVYTVWVGGDFMAGRFFSLPFLLGVLLLAWLPKRRMTAYAGLALLVALTIINPIAPLKTIPTSGIGWQWRFQNGVKDERGAHHNSVNPLTYEVFRVMPDDALAREGLSMAASSETTFVHPWIGLIGFYASPAKYVIDPNGLSDPLLARLPVGQDFYFAFWVSHWTRDLPQGYVESRRSGRNLITDPRIHAFFDKILNITEGPIFSWSRFRDIASLNWGSYRHFNQTIKSTMKLNYVAGVDNPLFTTDVGELAHAQLKSSGKAGYLVLGPGIPLDAGAYHVRWNGTVSSAGPDPGFVQVCYDDCRHVLVKTPLSPDASAGTVAAVDVYLPRAVRDIEYRLFAGAATQMTLQSIAITQQ